MSTILGPLPCQACRQPVHVVRRTVELPCGGWIGDDFCNTHKSWLDCSDRCMHTHAIPDVAWTVVDANGERHICEAAAA